MKKDVNKFKKILEEIIDESAEFLSIDFPKRKKYLLEIFEKREELIKMYEELEESKEKTIQIKEFQIKVKGYEGLYDVIEIDYINKWITVYSGEKTKYNDLVKWCISFERIESFIEKDNRLSLGF